VITLLRYTHNSSALSLQNHSEPLKFLNKLGEFENPASELLLQAGTEAKLNRLARRFTNIKSDGAAVQEFLRDYLSLIVCF
jgi:hypothetical protein